MRNALAPRPTLSAVLGLVAAARPAPRSPAGRTSGPPPDGPEQPLPVASQREAAKRRDELRPRGEVQTDALPRGASHDLLRTERRP
ncbi:hypothetical protein WMF45_28420 [Sorangium sp. So ce448]|uniref:hypothetical protein n=1 Tax=Sorangium sp. So ce448 TaxID=3133314 RepID=UPI003F5E6DC5